MMASGRSDSGFAEWSSQQPQLTNYTNSSIAISTLAEQTTRLGQLTLNSNTYSQSPRRSLDSVFAFDPTNHFHPSPFTAPPSPTPLTQHHSPIHPAYHPYPPPSLYRSNSFDSNAWIPSYTDSDNEASYSSLSVPSGSYPQLGPSSSGSGPGPPQPQNFSAMYEQAGSSHEGHESVGLYGPGPSSWYEFPAVEETGPVGPSSWQTDATQPPLGPALGGLAGYGSNTIEEESCYAQDSLLSGFAAPPSPSTPVSPVSPFESPARRSFEGGRSRPSSSEGRTGSSPTSVTRTRRNSSSSVGSSCGGRGTRKMHPCPYAGCGQSCQPL